MSNAVSYLLVDEAAQDKSKRRCVRTRCDCETRPACMELLWGTPGEPVEGASNSSARVVKHCERDSVCNQERSVNSSNNGNNGNARYAHQTCMW